MVGDSEEMRGAPPRYESREHMCSVVKCWHLSSLQGTSLLTSPTSGKGRGFRVGGGHGNKSIFITNSSDIILLAAFNYLFRKHHSELYRTIWLILDSVHRLVCGSFTKDHNVSVQWLRLALSDGPNWVGLSCPIHLRTETDPVSETLWSFVKFPHTRRWTESKRSQIILYNIHHRQNPFKTTRNC
jgi:hypothetical protein